LCLIHWSSSQLVAKNLFAAATLETIAAIDQTSSNEKNTRMRGLMCVRRASIPLRSAEENVHGAGGKIVDLRQVQHISQQFDNLSSLIQSTKSFHH
jgi:hypothetical protein